MFVRIKITKELTSKIMRIISNRLKHLTVVISLCIASRCLSYVQLIA